VTNVILAGDDDKDDDEEDFLVEEKPKDDLDLKTETSAPDNEVILNRKFSAINLNHLKSSHSVKINFSNLLFAILCGLD
jgi:hypothetical protein